MSFGKYRLPFTIQPTETFPLTFDRTLGYSSHDIISTMFRVTKSIPTLSEHSKLEFIREIGFTHMRILDGVQSLLQLSGCVSKLCKINMKPELFQPPKA